DRITRFPQDLAYHADVRTCDHGPKAKSERNVAGIQRRHSWNEQAIGGPQIVLDVRIRNESLVQFDAGIEPESHEGSQPTPGGHEFPPRRPVDSPRDDKALWRRLIRIKAAYQ